MPEINNDQHGVALDVGEQRIGVATARLDIRMASPLLTLADPLTFVSDIIELCTAHNAAWLVIGLPRGLDGQETAQTAWVRAFGKELEAGLQSRHMDIPVYWIDEALTSTKAEAELRRRTGKHTVAAKGDVDALAATYILEDFLLEHDFKTEE